MKSVRRLATLLKESRIRSGVTQHDLSKVLGYSSPQFVSNWERDMCPPPLKKLGKIARVLKINPTEILDAIIEDQTEEVSLILGLKKAKGKR